MIHRSRILLALSMVAAVHAAPPYPPDVASPTNDKMIQAENEDIINELTENFAGNDNNDDSALSDESDMVEEINDENLDTEPDQEGVYASAAIHAADTIQKDEDETPISADAIEEETEIEDQMEDGNISDVDTDVANDADDDNDEGEEELDMDEPMDDGEEEATEDTVDENEPVTEDDNEDLHMDEIAEEDSATDPVANEDDSIEQDEVSVNNTHKSIDSDEILKQAFEKELEALKQGQLMDGEADDTSIDSTAILKEAFEKELEAFKQGHGIDATEPTDMEGSSTVDDAATHTEDAEDFPETPSFSADPLADVSTSDKKEWTDGEPDENFTSEPLDNTSTDQTTTNETEDRFNIAMSEAAMDESWEEEMEDGSSASFVEEATEEFDVSSPEEATEDALNDVTEEADSELDTTTVVESFQPNSEMKTPFSKLEPTLDALDQKNPFRDPVTTESSLYTPEDRLITNENIMIGSDSDESAYSNTTLLLIFAVLVLILLKLPKFRVSFSEKIVTHTTFMS
ncbi:uncharacterized protein BYT42DRAFT_579376 [Radiomyces spectabilis]|uniref:uncharacterized protein n=1 Tax=Radiomyces spectabilis TaxID=64574 RepID=UPI00221F1238|nr:uncharacterized protein BYT42DRAFT_579376 [Radiomyces spectabilis]KAI8373153.1 hypothetical protein BYT42DRAFT_579376 [Radiomyces spectabilis]